MREKEQVINDNRRVIEVQGEIKDMGNETPSGVYQRIPLDVATPSPNIVRRQLPIVPPTPFEEDQRMSQLLLTESSSVTIINTPSIEPPPREGRILPETLFIDKDEEVRVCQI